MRVLPLVLGGVALLGVVAFVLLRKKRPAAPAGGPTPAPDVAEEDAGGGGIDFSGAGKALGKAGKAIAKGAKKAAKAAKKAANAYVIPDAIKNPKKMTGLSVVTGTAFLPSAARKKAKKIPLVGKWL